MDLKSPSRHLVQRRTQTHVACVKADRFPASVQMNASQTIKNCSSSGAIGAARTILVQRRERRGETIQILGLEDLLPHGLGGTLVVVNMVVPAARGLSGCLHTKAKHCSSTLDLAGVRLTIVGV